MASIRDVAIKAGVGIGTVSRALNGSGYISDETKQKIMQAVEELNYKPNELAQNLFHNKSGFYRNCCYESFTSVYDISGETCRE